MRHPWSWFFSLIVTLLLTAVIGVQAPADSAGRVLTGTAACCLLAMLAFPGEPGAAALRERLAWSLLAGLSGAGMAALTADVSAAAAARLGIGMALLIFLLLATTRLFARRMEGPAAATVAATAALAAAALPIYLGPLPEHFPEQRWLADAVVFGSPLSHLAGWLDYDYLREPWLYRHSRIGGLRFEYPSTLTSVATLLLAGVIMERAGRGSNSTTRKSDS